MGVDGAFFGGAGIAPGFEEELAAAEDASGFAGETGEEAEFRCSEGEGLSGENGLMAFSIDLQHLVCGGRKRSGRTAPEDGFHPGDQLARREGFADVVVGAEFESEDAIEFVVAGGEDDHRGAGLEAELAEKIEARAIGQAEVEQDEGEAIGVEEFCGGRQ